MYMYYEPNTPLVISGDFNSRLGDKQDVPGTLDYIPPRQNIDSNRNRFGQYLLEFLNDSNSCVLNGHGNLLLDNFTSISHRGRSVVDYYIVPRDQFKLMSEFSVKPVSDLISNNNITPTPTSRLPDHSVLQCVLCLSPSSLTGSLGHEGQRAQLNQFNDNTAITKQRKYLVSRNGVPDNLFGSVRCQNVLLGMIDSLIEYRGSQDKINELYKQFVSTLHDEMNEHLQFIDTHLPRGIKRTFKNKKAFWNNNLTSLWKNMCLNERKYIKFHGRCRQKQSLHSAFKESRRIFDIEYRRAERRYHAEKRNHIEQLDTSDPQSFWREINKIGPGKQYQHVCDTVKLDNNTITRDPAEIIKKWEDDYQGLYDENNNDAFDHDFINTVKERISEWDNDDSKLSDYITQLNGDSVPEDIVSNTLNVPILETETVNALRHAKLNKATGCDNLPNEILRSPKLAHLLHALFTTCFEHNVTPDDWNRIIISPIPKKGKDVQCPLNYRGISIISTVAKLFSYIMNKSLTKLVEQNNLLAEEQNGFRKKRSCLDHLFVLCTIIRNRKKQNLPTYTCFIDLSRAFDSIKHSLLWYKIVNSGVHGKFYNMLRTIYRCIKCCVKVPGIGLTDWFSVIAGVRQGDNLSPVLFAMYINDLIVELNSIGCGVKINDTDISVLAFADDIVLVSDSEEKLETNGYNHLLVFKVACLYKRGQNTCTTFPTKASSPVTTFFLYKWECFGIY